MIDLSQFTSNNPAYYYMWYGNYALSDKNSPIISFPVCDFRTFHLREGMARCTRLAMDGEYIRKLYYQVRDEPYRVYKRVNSTDFVVWSPKPDDTLAIMTILEEAQEFYRKRVKSLGESRKNAIAKADRINRMMFEEAQRGQNPSD